jgi:5-methylcytosine-specific restriction enzyme subunit McrC
MIPGIRGRIDFGLSLKSLSFQRGRAHCHYDIFCANVPSNQIIRSSLARVAKIGDFGPSGESADALRSKIRRLVRNLEGIDLVELTSEQIQRQRMKRLDADYGLMLAICHLLQRRLMPTEDGGDNRLPGLDRDDVTLHQIFESFVASFYKIHLSKHWTVRSQKSISWKAEPTSPYLPGMCLDVYLQHRTTNQVVVIDTKFTANLLVRGRWDNAVFDRNHLFQMYAYLRSQEEDSPSHRLATGILLYPVCRTAFSELVTIQGHRMHWETIDLTQLWQNIERDLLAIPVMDQRS